MCTSSNIKLMFTAMSVAKAIICIYMLVIGSALVSNVDYQRGYGYSVVGCGVWILLAGLLTPFSSCVGHIGSKLHNKFLLVSHASCDFIIFAIQLSIGGQLVAYTASEFKPPMREMCIQNTPLKYEEECIDWISSDRYAGLKLVWAAAYDKAFVDADELARIEGWEAENQCCGYGPPERCEDVDTKIPKQLSDYGVPSAYSSTRVVCGDQSEWYPDSGRDNTYCGHFFDPTLAFPIVGGCRYEMPGTRCKDKDVAFDSKGCAAQLQVIFDSDMQVKGYSCMIASCFEVLAIIMACCFCWKRKSHDILPAYLEQVPYDPYAKKEVKPMSTSGEEKKDSESGH